MDGPDSTTVSGTYVATARAFAAMVARIPVASYDGPGLGDWDLRALVGHTSRSVVTVLTYLDRPATEAVHGSAAAYYAAIAGGSFDPGEVLERGRAAGIALGDDPAASVAGLVEQVEERLRGVGLGYVMETIVGPMRLGDYLPTRTFELVVHGLDLERATGVPAGLPHAALAEATGLAAAVAVLTGDGGQVLLALTGRAPLPEGFSVV